ncbi:MAG: ABC transporter ATP-binding protein [Clostridia bacterium]|nr:ABC transporter ATP-binding protein [Clostridia bacterium]
MIRLENITKIYQMGDTEVRALDGVSIHIKPHEFVSIIGPSGSGKSTLMNMIGCLDVPTGGRYWIDGVEGSKMTDNQLADLRNRKIGFIFQQYNLLNKLSALENVELPLIYRGIPAAEREAMAKRALERVGLIDKIHHKPTELSGGQQQRVSVARALSANPSLILADEPTGALDSKSGVEIMQMLHDLHADGNTVVIITHDLNIAKQAERIITIRDGKITSDIDNKNDRADATNVKGSDIGDNENGKTADLDADLKENEEKEKYIHDLLENTSSGGDAE